MFKPVLFIIAASTAATMLAVPLSSQSPAEDIVVTPRSSAAFAHEVGNDLNLQLAKMQYDQRWDTGGLIKVRFRASSDGTPTDVTTYMSSGNRVLDRKTIKAVKGLTSLSPLPTGANQGSVIQANIIVASTSSQMRDLEKKLVRTEAERLASNDPAERAVFAISMLPRPRT